MNDWPLYIELPIMLAALLIAIIGHEVMHALSAYYYGDDTAKNQNRLSLNPFKHFDLIGSLLLPLGLFLLHAPFLFGWAKPVPIQMQKVISNGGYKGAIVVSASGILYNLFLALLVVGILQIISHGEMGSGFGSGIDEGLAALLVFFGIQLVFYNAMLAIFNAYPIPPLDGAHILAYFGLLFGTHALSKYNNIHPMLGMAAIMIILSSPLAQYFFAPLFFLFDWLIKGIL